VKHLGDTLCFFFNGHLLKAKVSGFFLVHSKFQGWSPLRADAALYWQ
jgi:hypothetical protein